MGLIRIPGVAGLVREADISPCRECGGAVFWIGKGKLACVRCVLPRSGERTFGFVDMVKRQVRLGKPDGNGKGSEASDD